MVTRILTNIYLSLRIYTNDEQVRAMKREEEDYLQFNRLSVSKTLHKYEIFHCLHF